MTLFFKRYNSIQALPDQRHHSARKGGLQSPEQREGLDGLYRVHPVRQLLHRLPSFWWNPDKFVGPAGLLQAYRFLADSRDREATGERLDNLEDPTVSSAATRDRELRGCHPKG